MKSENDVGSNDTTGQLSQVLQSGLPEADLLRAATLDNLQFLRQARATGLQSEQERLAAKLGDDHLESSSWPPGAGNESFINGLAAESERAGSCACGTRTPGVAWLHPRSAITRRGKSHRRALRLWGKLDQATRFCGNVGKRLFSARCAAWRMLSHRFLFMC